MAHEVDDFLEARSCIGKNLNLLGKNARRIALATIAGAALAACTGVTSPEIGGQYDTRTGPVYFMPTTRIALSVTVNETANIITVTAGQPIYVPDERHRYRLNSIYSPFHAETAEFKVQNGLLTSVDLESDGRLDEIAVAVAKSAFAVAENAAGSGETMVYSTSIDVERLAGSSAADNLALSTLNNEIDLAVRGYMAKKGDASFLPAAAANYVKLRVARAFPDAAVADDGNPALDEEDCRVGFCYRLPVGYTVSATFFDESAQEASFAVPNGSPIYAAAVNRGLFAKWHTTAMLENGVLKSYKIETSGSEVEELALLPAELVGGVIAGITQQGALFNAQSTLIDSRLKLLEAKAKQAAEAGKAENSGSSDPLFEFTAGTKPAVVNQQINNGTNGEVESEDPKKAIGELD